MAGFASPRIPSALLSTNSAPIIGSKFDPLGIRVRAPSERKFGSVCLRLRLRSSKGGILLKRVNAKGGFQEIEPDIDEDPLGQWDLNSVSDDDFKYGIWDNSHTYNGEDETAGTFWELLVRDYHAAGPPTGFQGIISWLFLPAILLGIHFDVPNEYLYIGAALFTIVFCIIEMDKPSEPYNFEPQIYNMKGSNRDKLIADYNSMNIYEFNEKYGELWDFTVDNEDIIMKQR